MFNKGQWGELYTILYLTINKKITRVDENINAIKDNKKYEITKIIYSGFNNITINLENDQINVFVNHNFWTTLDKNEVEKFRLEIINTINSKHEKAIFEIKSASYFLAKFFDNKWSPAPNNKKADLDLEMIEENTKIKKRMSYSIKTFFKNNPTILKASANTSFIYKAYGFNPENVKRANEHFTNSEIIQKMNFVVKNSKVYFKKIDSVNFDANVSSFGKDFKNKLANALFYSVAFCQKDLIHCFIKGNFLKVLSDEDYQNIKDFLYAAVCGLFPGKIFNGDFEVNGGLLIVNKKGEVFLLDNYYPNIIKDFLIRNALFSIPPQKTYPMGELKVIDNNVYFNLLLQIRLNSPFIYKNTN